MAECQCILFDSKVIFVMDGVCKNLAVSMFKSFTCNQNLHVHGTNIHVNLRWIDFSPQSSFGHMYAAECKVKQLIDLCKSLHNRI